MNLYRRFSQLCMISACLTIAAGCASNIRVVENPNQAGLRANWRNYQTYCLNDYAILFQVKGERTIQKEDGWREVTDDGAATGCASFYNIPVSEIIGENGMNFGYIIYNPKDGVSVTILDPKTIRLFYHVHPKGP